MTNIQKEYNDWITTYGFNLIEQYGSYIKLLEFLHSIEFVAKLDLDSNRMSDGKELRMRFVEGHPDYTYRDVYLYLDSPVSLLEVMIGLAVRCEENIMSNPETGDRTGLWFYTMLESSHLSKMDDYNFDIFFVENTVFNLINRNYGKDGDGGFFRVPGVNFDMREIDIWKQMHTYINYKYPLFE